jgi:hypothetical protein
MWLYLYYLCWTFGTAWDRPMFDTHNLSEVPLTKYRLHMASWQIIFICTSPYKTIGSCWHPVRDILNRPTRLARKPLHHLCDYGYISTYDTAWNKITISYKLKPNYISTGRNSFQRQPKFSSLGVVLKGCDCSLEDDDDDVGGGETTSPNCGHQLAYCSPPGDIWAWRTMVEW